MSNSLWYSLFGTQPSYPVKLKAGDETQLIMAVAKFAMDRLGLPDPYRLSTDGKMPSVDKLFRSRSNHYGLIQLSGSISREDLAFLAPYIDEWINGGAPPQNLPSEYYDWRPDTLRAPKDRMIKEGLWPD